jgi:aspartate kinase
MKILKFGGSSIKNGSRMLNVLEIIKRQKCKKIVVLSACGGISDMLISAANFAKNKEITKAISTAEKIISHHQEIINELIKNEKIKAKAEEKINNFSAELLNLLDGVYLLQELTPAAMDSIFAFGELLSTTIFHHLCLENNVENNWFDARKFMITNSDFNSAIPISEKFEPLVNEILNEKNNSNLAITQGFIGSDLNGKTTTLGRGGSDLTASLIGAALNADEIQIWTDVNGVLTADPSKVKNTKSVVKMSFSEIKDLSFWGAKVLHPKCILPAIEKNIKLVVLNSFEPESAGTTIVSECFSNKMQVHSVIAKTNCCFLKISVNNFTEVVDLIEITKNNFDLLYSSYNNGILGILCENNENFISENFSENSNANNIIFSEKVSVICISGQNFKSQPVEFTEFIAKVAKKLGNVKLHQLLFQFSENSVIFVVDECEISEITEQIHSLILEYF